MTSRLILGTAQWGWTVSRDKAFSLLDTWLQAGHKQIDCATNYPINRNPDDFRAAERILFEYVLAHGLKDLQVTMKIGGLDNMRSPDSNLNPSFVQMMADEYRRLLGENLDCLMFHWDNRQAQEVILGSLEALSNVQREHGIRPGLSGIKHPNIYAAALQILNLRCDIQVKHNLLQSDLQRYLPHFSSKDHCYFAYGINAGGLKLDGAPYPSDSTFLARGGNPDQATEIQTRLAALLPELNAHKQRPPLYSTNQLGMIYAGLNPNIHGIILGVSSVAQLEESLHFLVALERNDFEDVYARLT